MKKAVWIAFGAAIVGVNAAAEAVEYFTDTELVAYFRVMLIMGVIDDKMDLRASLKLLIQLILAYYVFKNGIKIDSSTDLLKGY